MEKELEATFSNINVDKIRDGLRKIGAELIYPERLMRRYIFAPFKTDDLGREYIRVRDEGDEKTMSIKRFIGEKIEDQFETCLSIDDFDQGYQFLKQLGLEQKAYQETKREKWVLDGVEIVIDTWPGLNPFIEIEGPTVAQVKKVVDALNFNYEEAIFGPVEFVYEKELGITAEQINNQTSIITFDNPPKKEDYE